MVTIPKTFRDSNYQDVEYDGSPVHWRISAYGLCIIDEKLLLVRHIDEQFYDIPGGGIEMDETVEEAMKREAQEEAGWELTPIKPILTASDWFYHIEEKRFYKSFQIYFEAGGKQVLDEPTDHRIKEVLQVPLNEIGQYELYPNLKRALEIVRPDAV